jgi:hypothetical protein
MEKPMLTREEIERAKQNLSHPIVRFLLKEKNWVSKFTANYKRQELADVQKFVSESMSGLAKRLNTLDDFSMAPLDIVSIWSQVGKDFSSSYTENNFDVLSYARGGLSSTISAAYATRGIVSPEWEEVLPFVARERELPERVFNDAANQSHFWRRIQEIMGSVAELDFYSYGSRESLHKLRMDACEDSGKYEKLMAWREKHDDALLSRIHEDFGNAIGILYAGTPEGKRKIS